MNITTIAQGFSNNPQFTADYQPEFFSLKNANELLLCYAYLTEAGVQHLSNATDLTVIPNKLAFVEISNGISSVQGITNLLELGFNVFTVKTNKSNCKMHIKASILSSDLKSHLLAGSSNLTDSALTSNIELNFLFKLENNNTEDLNFLKHIKDNILSFPSIYPDNVTRIHSANDLDDLIVKGDLIDETVSKSSSNSSKKKESSETSIPTPTWKSKINKNRKSTKNPANSSGVLVWRKNKLTKSDAQVAGSNTHPKGYITMGNKSWRKNSRGEPVNNKEYMRNNIFGDLNWQWDQGFDREEAYCNFSLFINGTFIAKEKLLITDRPSREPAHHGGQDQKQPTTSLHISKFPKNKINSIVDKNLELYKLDTNNYRIEINDDDKKGA